MMNSIQQIELQPEGGWNHSEQIKLEPLTDKQLGFFKRRLIKFMVKVGTANCTNLYRTFFRNSRIYLMFARLNARLMPNGSIGRRETELCILRTAWLKKSRYEWGQHIDIGRRIGLTTEDIRRITKGPEANGWDKKEITLLRATDEFHADAKVADSTWKELASYYSDKQLIELLMLLGLYGALAGVLNSSGVRLETEVEAIMQTV